jgi:hypothetical protein
MNDDDFDDSSEEMTGAEIKLAVNMALGELLNIATIAADLQSTDEAADDIYAMCDLVAQYHGIERARIEVTENSDGSFTSRLQSEDGVAPTATASKKGIPGSIQTRGKLKYRVVDVDTTPDIDDLLDEDEGPQ